MTPWIERSAGVLLHVSSLPGGVIGPDAGEFVRRLAAAGVRVWQILPVGPPAKYANPFEPASAFAGDPRLIAPGAPRASCGDYLDTNADWLPDWALYAALKTEQQGAPWWDWPAELRRREPSALAAARQRLAETMDAAVQAQCAFEEQWQALRATAHAAGVRIFGDVPLFVSRDSADVWAQRELFEVDVDGHCVATVGVPPDAFSETGQWWGFPPYRWDAMARSGFAWWRRRFEVQARRFDFVRLDHFRGLAAWWRIPADAPNAAHGHWAPGPADAALAALEPVLHGARLVAEDLGVITDDVVALRQRFGLPGMRVLQFAFDGNPHNPHLPQHHGPDTVCYTGTHDNDTALGWWRTASAHERGQFAAFAGRDDPPMPQALVDCAWAAPAPLSIVPLQDLLGLDSAARMNRPGVAGGNWRWRFSWEQLPADFADRLRKDLLRHGRTL